MDMGPAALLLLLHLACASNPTTGSGETPLLDEAPVRGYQTRACGFDLNRNGIAGEDADCHVCDGSTLDPDGDGVDEDLLYVDCTNGVDSPTCGTPQAPCKGLQFTWKQRADGPDDGAEDILCFRGVCAEGRIDPAFPGLPEVYVDPQDGSEARAFELPRQPAMLVGWDSDGDGAYPPHDGHDEAILEGNGLDFALQFGGGDRYLEIAHFIARNYGRTVGSGVSSGFADFGTNASGLASHVHLHDLVLRHINRDRSKFSGTIVFQFFRAASQIQHIAMRNIESTHTGGYFARGSGLNNPGSEDGPYRWQNLTVTAHGCDFSTCGNGASFTGWKLWGYVSGIEILDSVFDANVGVWEPKPAGGPDGANLVAASECSRDWTIRNNEIRDFKVALRVQGYSPKFCDHTTGIPRSTHNVVFDSNVYRNTYEPWGGGDGAVQIVGGGPTLGSTVQDVVISNNVFSSSPDWTYLADISGGNLAGPNPGTVWIVNNTVVADQYRADFGTITVRSALPFPHQSVVVANNLISGLGGDDTNLRLTYTPAFWFSDHNVFDGDGNFVWNGVPLPDLTALHLLGYLADQNSAECDPLFVDPAASDFHLQDTDVCARNRGININAISDRDLEFERRGRGASWDIGADEVLLFSDGFEPGDASRWTTTAPPADSAGPDRVFSP